LIDIGRPYELRKPSEKSLVKEHEIVILEEILKWYQQNSHRLPKPDLLEYTPDPLPVTPEGREIVMYIDGLSKDKKTIFEYKYAKSDYDHLDLRRQLSLYFAGVPEAEVAKVIVFKKPGLRPKKDEDLEAFRKRVCMEIEKRDMKLVEISEFHREEFPIQQELRNMDALVHLIELAAEMQAFPGNYLACDNCDYRAYCKEVW